MEINTVDQHQAGVVIYGPQGCGKSTHASALAAHFGKTRIVDDWTPGGRVSDNTLALTSEPHHGAIPFIEALYEAGIRPSPAFAVSPTTPRPATVDQLMSETFDRPRDECSEAYRQGVCALFTLRIEATPIPRRYVAGTADYDAFHFGIREGQDIWRETQTANLVAA